MVDIQDWGVIISLLISSITLFVVIFKEFVEGAKPHSSIIQLLILRIPEKNRNELLFEMLLDDLLSQRPSTFCISFV